MASSKISDLTTIGTADTGDAMAIVDDPAGTPASRQVRVGTLFDSIQDWRLIAFGSANTTSSVLAINIAGFEDYNTLKIVFNGLEFDTDNVNIGLRTSSDSGSTFDSTSGDYQYAFYFLNQDSSAGDNANSSADKLFFQGSLGNDASQGWNCEVNLYQWVGTTQYPAVTYMGAGVGTPGTYTWVGGQANRRAAVDVDQLQIVMSAGDVDAGNYYIYGLKGV